MGGSPTRQLSLRPVAIGAVVEDEAAEVFGVEGHVGNLVSMQTAARGERRKHPAIPPG